jgi:hypothetical protein
MGRFSKKRAWLVGDLCLKSHHPFVSTPAFLIPLQPQFLSKMVYEVGTIAYKIRAVTRAPMPQPTSVLQDDEHTAQGQAAATAPPTADIDQCEQIVSTSNGTERPESDQAAAAEAGGGQSADVAPNDVSPLRPASLWDEDDSVALFLQGPGVRMADEYPRDVPHLHAPHRKQAVTDVSVRRKGRGGGLADATFGFYCLYMGRLLREQRGRLHTKSSATYALWSFSLQ